MKTGFDYGRYLASREWALKKRAVWKRSRGICERCKVGPYQETHHLTYERLGCERLEDLQALCIPCHEYESAVASFDPLHPVTSENPDYITILEPIAKIADPESRKHAAIHLANALRVPPSLFLEQLKRMTGGA